MAVIASTHSQCSMLCLSSGNRTSITSYCTILLEFVARPSSVIKILVALRFRRPMFLCMLRLCFSHMLVCHAGTSNAQSRLKSKEIFRTKKEAQSNDRMQTRIAGLLACKRIRVCHAPFGLMQERHFCFPWSISIVDQSFFFSSASLSPHASILSKTCEHEVRLWCIPLPDENSTFCAVR